MSAYAIVHLPSGAVITLSSIMPDSLQGDLVWIDIAEGALRPDAVWWDGEEFQPREDATLDAGCEYARAGDVLSLTGPSDAWVSGIDGSFHPVADVTLPEGYRSFEFTLVGKYRGSCTVQRIDPVDPMAAIREERDRRLALSDKYVLPDYPIPEGQRSLWISYRIALRQLPEQQPEATMATVVWPVSPETE